jgi:Ni/Co efflux regulator RcnB
MKRLVLAAVAASMLALPAVQAQAGPREPFGQSSQWNKQPPRGAAMYRHGHFDKRVERRDAPHWRQGHRYSAWRQHQPIRDYHRHGLRRPAYGQQWIRVGNDYLLIGIATGMIVGALAAH